MKERAQIVAENRRRRESQGEGLYAPWHPAEIFMRQGRSRRAIELLRQADLFPREGQRILEVGCGEGGWCSELLGWRLATRDLWGIDLDLARVAVAQRRFTGARFAVADAGALPFPTESFDLVIASTVFSSLLEPRLQEQVAAEMARVLRRGGAALVYDFAIDNPRNPQVRGVPTRRLRALFAGLVGPIVRVTLAPPLARLLAPRWPVLAAWVEVVPWLRTHRLALLRKPPLRWIDVQGPA